MNLPNKITLFRACMIPFFVVCLLVDTIPGHTYLAAAIFILASLSDALDGYLARKYHLVTNFGKFMDPLADKLLVCAALICFVGLGLVPAWIIIVIISREFIISGFRLIASDNGVVIAASYWGKLKTTAQMVMCVLLILHLKVAFWGVLEQIFIWLSLVLTVVSLVDYMVKNKGVLAEKQ